MKRSLFTGPMLKVLVIVAVIALVIYAVYSNAGFPTPRESDRVTAFDGSFSVIKPRGWDSKVAQGMEDGGQAAAIEFSSAKAIGLGERLAVARVQEPQKAKEAQSLGFKRDTFQGRDAWIQARKVKLDWQILMYFQGEDENWYRMDLRVGRPEELRDSKWWPIVMSFKSRPKSAGSTTYVGKEIPASQSSP